MSQTSSYYNINWLKDDGSVVSSNGNIIGGQFITDVSCPYYPGNNDLGVAISQDSSDAMLIKRDNSPRLVVNAARNEEKPIPQPIVNINKSLININLNFNLNNWFKKIITVTNNSNLSEEEKASLLSSYSNLQNIKEPNGFVKVLNGCLSIAKKVPAILKVIWDIKNQIP